MGRLKQPEGLLHPYYSAILNQKPSQTIIDTNSVHDAYVLTLEALKRDSVEITSNGKKTKNLQNVIIEMTPLISELHPKGYFPKRVFCEKRNLTNKVQNAEFAWYMTLNNNVNGITKYIKKWADFSDDGKTVNSNYGHMWGEQIIGVIKKIIFDKYTRQGSFTLYDEFNANIHDSKDISCTLSVDFKILPRTLGGDELHMTVMMRSNDVVKGLPIDMFCFANLHELLRNELALYYDDLYLGTYTHIATSMHIYDYDYDKLDGIVRMSPEKQAKKEGESAILPSITYMNFWVLEPNYIMGNLDSEHFKKYKQNQSMFYSLNFVNTIVEEIYINKYGSYTNIIKVEELMPVFDDVVKHCEEFQIGLPAQEYAKDKVKMFDLLYDCAKISGETMLSTVFLATVILSRDLQHFKGSYNNIIGFATKKFPITRYCAYQSVLNYSRNNPSLK